ncbi:MAG TPA: ATP-binding protein [Syntrophorhabdaceae bacterium]|nr:ATP-binding protein [Syntrophorhabdaceae bacterium]
MKRSLFLKIFGGYFFLTVALSGLIVLFSSYAIRNHLTDRTARELKDIASVAGAAAALYSAAGSNTSLNVFVKELGGQVHARITIVEPDGRVIADSEEDPLKMDNHRTRTEIAQALEGGTGRYLRVSETLGQEMLYIAVPVQKDNKTVRVIRASRFLKDIRTVSRELNSKILLITSIILTISLFAAFLFARALYRPVGELSAAIKRVACHDFNVRVLLKEQDELKEVAESFNTMTDEMQGLFAELTRQKEELNSIITSLQEGLLVLDREERVLIANKSLQEITGQALAAGKFYWETLREPGINEVIKRVREDRSNHVEEIELNNMIFLCSATFLNLKEEVVLVLHDITEIKKLEKIKTDFVLNVSHELRTPLTSIKGFIDTIEEGELSDENRRYLEIIKRNTDRLINVVSDLLVLSELEEKSFMLEPEAVKMPELIERVFKVFEDRIRSKGFSIDIQSPAGLPPVMGDPFKLEQVFINLFDNTIKYTENGGISIEMSASEQNVIISISDTGPGIPPEHTSRIFERFYVVDKSRSKKLGGTGLGLSIVKHIILLHNGKIAVESTPGKGTKFVITLPAYM